MVASEDGSRGWSGLQRDEEYSKWKKRDPSVSKAREGGKAQPRSPGNNVLDHLATGEAAAATAGQLGCGPEAQEAPGALTPSAPLHPWEPKKPEVQAKVSCTECDPREALAGIWLIYI